MMSVRPQPLQGSYERADCLFLLKPIQADYRSIEDKERLIQTGQLHYSQMIHKESVPTEQYQRLFLDLTAQYQRRLAAEVMSLAQEIGQRRDGAITLVSLARAGTPIGVLLQRALSQHLHRQSTHYSISIVRDRGIDQIALDYILEQGHCPSSIVFVDGWTAKGVISRELQQAVTDYNHKRLQNPDQASISPELFVISDIGGTADVAATYDDYTIPSALMNSTVSGLISRSILNDQISDNDFHGCVVYEHLREHDQSTWFIEQVAQHLSTEHMAAPVKVPRQQRQQQTQRFLQQVIKQHQVSDINRIKPGIAEATRVMLRRVPDLLILRQRSHPDTAHLVRLAEEKSIPVQEQADMPFGACALIRDVVNTVVTK